ncbi:MAG: hypothetical protein PHN49_10740, partial [Candidatus Omnitrophica bacterium]|nr:hypothetical protein [Candidatus Omnitrophota bacterium]
ILSGLVFEPRKGDHLPRLGPAQEKLARLAEHYSRHIYRKELIFRVYPYCKLPHFHMARAVEAWTYGVSFDELARLASADEGEFVRHFRMVIQILRELAHAPHASEKLHTIAAKAAQKINRDVVDAEKQLRV